MLYTFDDEKIPSFTYAGYGGSWRLNSSMRYSGTYSFSPPVISDSQYSEATITVSGGVISFYYYISSEGSCGFFQLYIDGTRYINISGQGGWYWYSNNLAPGNHTVKFKYLKDGSVVRGYDTVFIDQLTLNTTQVYTATATSSIVSPQILNEISTKYNIMTSGDCVVKCNDMYSANDGLPDESFDLLKTILIYNLSDDLIDAIQVFIEPVVLNSNIYGYNEIDSGLYILNDHFIDIKIEDKNYHIINDRPGRSVTNPIIYKKTINDEISFIYGNDNTSRGKDWIRFINHTNKPINVLQSLPCSGNIVFNKSYFLNHAINYSSVNYIKVSIYIKNTIENYKRQIIESCLANCKVNVTYSLYNKTISSSIGLLYGDDIIIRDKDSFNVRW